MGERAENHLAEVGLKRQTLTSKVDLLLLL